MASKARPASSAKMNVAGWEWIKIAEKKSNTFNPALDILTADRQQIYGVLLKDKGERYGVEINGTRKSGWGKGQNFDFQKTPAYMALKTSADLMTSIQLGYKNSIKDSMMAKAFSSGEPSVQQMVLWMNELSEISILDYIFSQQDRVGNIDYQWYWTYVDESGDVKAEKVSEQYSEYARSKMDQIPVPAELKMKKPTLVQKTYLGDNDAGGLVQYANFTKSTGMLDGIQGVTSPISHLNKKTYDRLQKLAMDFRNRGPNYQVLDREFRIVGFNDVGDKRFRQMINNTISAADIFANNCRAGILKLDLVSFKSAMNGQYQASDMSCDVR